MSEYAKKYQETMKLAGLKHLARDIYGETRNIVLSPYNLVKSYPDHSKLRGLRHDLHKGDTPDKVTYSDSSPDNVKTLMREAQKRGIRPQVQKGDDIKPHMIADETVDELMKQTRIDWRRLAGMGVTGEVGRQQWNNYREDEQS